MVEVDARCVEPAFEAEGRGVRIDWLEVGWTRVLYSQADHLCNPLPGHPRSRKFDAPSPTEVLSKCRIRASVQEAWMEEKEVEKPQEEEQTDGLVVDEIKMYLPQVPYVLQTCTLYPWLIAQPLSGRIHGWLAMMSPPRVGGEGGTATQASESVCAGRGGLTGTYRSRSFPSAS
ncbi:hypothetical protein VTI74DRAFT_2650 [Chaetomium olivicolor]